MKSHLLIQTLKATLKQEGISLQQAAAALDLSVSSVKRLFAEKSFTLPRIEKLCELAGIDLFRLHELAAQSEYHSDSLSLEQEQALVASPELMLVGVCLVNRWKFNEIQTKYAISRETLTQIFVKLDRLGIIEFLPHNRYRLCVKRNFKWLPNGPIQQFFISTLLHGMTTEGVDQPGNHMYCQWAMITEDTAKALNKSIQRLIVDYLAMAEQDSRYSAMDKLTSSLMICFREDWEPKLFKDKVRLDR